MIPSSEMASFMADLKDHLNITTTKHDGELVGKLEAAFEVAQSLVGRYFYRDVITETLGAAGVLARRPVVSIDSVLYAGSNVGMLSYSDTRAVIYGARSGSIVTYTYGQIAPTPAQREGVLLIAAHLWDTQRGQATGPLQDDGSSFVPGYGHAIPNRARDLLRPPSPMSGVA